MNLACLMELRMRAKHFEVECCLLGQPANKRLRNRMQEA